ncbi:MAG TPA: hypothetical protein EYM43_06625 [Alphaproteobacteria bacterium]|nr:hypothetical protein [Alphaproteobacteria bacterium]
MRLIDFFDRGASLEPDRAAFIDENGTLSYREAQIRTHQIANALMSESIAAGDVVAIYSPNDARAFLCMLGILRAGAVYVNLNGLSMIEENLYVLKDRDACLLFIHSLFAKHLDCISKEAPKVTRVIGIDCALEGAPSLTRWLAPQPETAPDISREPSDVACLFSTGGTTGRSKAAMLTNRAFETMIANANTAMPHKAPPIHLVAAPITHAAGLAALWLLPLGATNVILARPDPETVMAAISEHKVTTLFLPPTVIYMMLAHPRLNDFDYSSLDYLIYGAAPMSVDKLKQAIKAFGPVLTQLYGQAEAPMMCTVMLPFEHVRWLETGAQHRLASCGRPCLFTDLAIMDESGNLLGPDERGEIVVRGNLVMAGYYKNPEASATVSAHGWHHTGDIGAIDQAGYVYILDRKNDMIISGGFNIYPGEIEQVLWALPEVQDCAVVGAPDDKWGEAVTAVVELVDGAAIDEEAIISHCKTELGSVKAPKAVLFWDKLPRSPVGKVLRRTVREKFWADRDRTI